MTTTPDNTARRIRRLNRKIRYLNDSVNWLWFMLGITIAMIVTGFLMVGMAMSVIRKDSRHGNGYQIATTRANTATVQAAGEGREVSEAGSDTSGDRGNVR